MDENSLVMRNKGVSYVKKKESLIKQGKKCIIFISKYVYVVGLKGDLGFSPKSIINTRILHKLG
ncbi:hypothetical protein Hanom_Chr04g00310081 [Helianthus anomalus]